MDPFRMALAMGPLAAYLLWLGWLNLGRRPRLLGGTSDAAALGLALSGLMIIGPLELLFPPGLALRLGPYAWLLLAGMYAAGLAGVLLRLRPRLVIYNITRPQLRPLLAEVAARLDPAVQWAGDSLALPSLGIQLHLDQLRSLRNVSLVPLGARNSWGAWRQLRRELAAALGRLEVQPNPAGATLLSLGLFILAMVGWQIARDPHGAAQTFFQMIRR